MMGTNSRVDSTTIEIMGSPAVVFGLPGDDYFIKLPAYAAQNAMFVAENFLETAPS